MQRDGLQPRAVVISTSVVQLVQGGQHDAEEDVGEPDVAAVEYDTYHNHDQGMTAPEHPEQQEESGEAGSPLSSLTDVYRNRWKLMCHWGLIRCRNSNLLWPTVAARTRVSVMHGTSQLHSQPNCSRHICGSRQQPD